MKQIEWIDFLRSSFSTLDFTDLAEEVVEGLGISPELVNTILTRYMRVVLRNV